MLTDTRGRRSSKGRLFTPAPGINGLPFPRTTRSLTRRTWVSCVGPLRKQFKGRSYVCPQMLS